MLKSVFDQCSRCEIMCVCQSLFIYTCRLISVVKIISSPIMAEIKPVKPTVVEIYFVIG